MSTSTCLLDSPGHSEHLRFDDDCISEINNWERYQNALYYYKKELMFLLEYYILKHSIIDRI